MALEILRVIQRIVKSSEGKLSVVLSIHQPNEAILALFDHIMILGKGGMMYFGTVPDSMQYFSDIGFPPPIGISPTDFYLKITDQSFSSNVTFSFESSYSCSIHAHQVAELICCSTKHAENFVEEDEEAHSVASTGDVAMAETVSLIKRNEEQNRAFDTKGYEFTARTGQTGFFIQCATLMMRDLTLARRDLTLYYLQFALHAFYGFLVGAAFFQLDYSIDAKMNYIPAGLCWIVFMNSYMHVFKVYHIVVHQARTFHESRNGSYSIFAAWVAETIVVCIMLVIFTPGFIIAYFMMGFPVEPFPFLLLSYWTCAVAGESLLSLLSIFFIDATAAIVSSQALLVVLTVFCGVFISWNDMPDYWLWLQESAAITQSSRAAFVAVSEYIEYDCDLSAGLCVGPTGMIFDCIAGSVTANQCVVDGRTVLQVTQGVGYDESHWKYYGALVGIFFALRLALLFFMYFPPRELYAQAQTWMRGNDLLSTQVALRKLRMQMTYLLKANHPSDDVKNTTVPSSAKATDSRVPPALRDRSESQADFETEMHTTAPMPGKVSKFGSQFFHGQEGAALRFRNVNLTLKGNGTKLLTDVTAVCEPGRVMALMGPSGAGKTTLLNALAGRAPYADVSGSIMFGNRPMVPADLMYVPQFDEILPVLSVEEALLLIGELKCVDREDMHRRLPQLLRILGLYGKRNMPCGELTGGELKRVSVGMGMIVAPNVLFLDEPTTGLDSSAAFSMVDYVVQVAQKSGVIVIMTIHQPSAMVFGMLQDLLLLERGRMAFCGSSTGALLYFEELGFSCPKTINPADYYLELIHAPPVAPANGSAYEALFHADATWRSIFEARRQQYFSSNATAESDKGNGKAYVAPATSLLSQFNTQLRFFMKYYFREAGFYFYRAIFLIVVALFVGTMFLRLKPTTDNVNKYAGALFFAVWAVLFSSIGATGLTASNRLVAINQIQNGVIHPAVYVLAQFIVSLPYNLVCATIFQSILHWLVNMNPRAEPFFYAILITWGHLIYMEAIMAVVVQVLHDAMLSVIFSMICLGTLFLFPGFFVQVSDIPAWVSWISYIIGTKYSFDGYLYQVFHSETFDISGFPGRTIDGDDILDNAFGNSGVEPWSMFGVLLAWMLMFRLVHYALFRYEVRYFVAGRQMHQSVPAASEKKVAVQGGGYQELSRMPDTAVCDASKGAAGSEEP